MRNCIGRARNSAWKHLATTLAFVTLGPEGARMARAQAPAPTCLLKIATVAPEGSTWMKVLRDIDAEVRQETGNAVGFKIYAGGVQGDEQVVLRKVRSGQLHGGAFTGAGLGLIASAERVLELPFLFHNYDEIDRVHAKVDPKLEAVLHDAGFTVLGWAEVGFVYLFSRQPLGTQAQLQSAKMWLWEGDPLAEAFFRSAGIVPVPLSITDVMTSLQTKLVDGVYASPLGCVALQWFTRVAYFTDFPVSFASSAIVVSNGAFDRVPAEQREKVRAICTKRFRELVLRTRKENEDALLEIEKSGVKRVKVEPAAASRFEEIGRKVWKEQVGKLYPPELLDLVLGTLGKTSGDTR
jgi:TRAP-type C4-dicarboxylate transport system substrate-binding protein